MQLLNWSAMIYKEKPLGLQNSLKKCKKWVSFNPRKVIISVPIIKGMSMNKSY